MRLESGIEPRGEASPLASLQSSHRSHIAASICLSLRGNAASLWTRQESARLQRSLINGEAASTRGRFCLKDSPVAQCGSIKIDKVIHLGVERKARQATMKHYTRWLLAKQPAPHSLRWIDGERDTGKLELTSLCLLVLCMFERKSDNDIVQFVCNIKDKQ